MRQVVMGLAVWTAIAGAFGCDDADPASIDVVTGDTSVSAVVGTEGAVLELSSGTRLDIPRGALDEDIEIEVAETSRSRLAEDSVDARSLETPVAMLPHGTRFNKDIEVELPLSRDNMELKTRDLRIMRLADEEDDQWRPVEGELERRGDRVAFKIDRFSIYVIAEAAATATVDPNMGTDVELMPEPIDTPAEDAGFGGDPGSGTGTAPAMERDAGAVDQKDAGSLFDVCMDEPVGEFQSNASALSDTADSVSRCISSCAVYTATSGTCYYIGDGASSASVESADAAMESSLAALTSEELNCISGTAVQNRCGTSVFCNMTNSTCEEQLP